MLKLGGCGKYVLRNDFHIAACYGCVYFKGAGVRSLLAYWRPALNYEHDIRPSEKRQVSKMAQRGRSIRRESMENPFAIQTRRSRRTTYVDLAQLALRAVRNLRHPPPLERLSSRIAIKLGWWAERGVFGVVGECAWGRCFAPDCF